MEGMMTIQPKIQHQALFRGFMGLAIFAGVFGLILQFFPMGGPPSGWDFFFIFGPFQVLTGIIIIKKDLDEREQQLLFQSFSLAFLWTFFLLFFVMCFYVLTEYLNFLQGITIFMSGHWLGLTISFMCILLGLAGFRSYGET
jgi:hypothetical protein